MTLKNMAMSPSELRIKLNKQTENLLICSVNSEELLTRAYNGACTATGGGTDILCPTSFLCWKWVDILSVQHVSDRGHLKQPDKCLPCTPFTEAAGAKKELQLQYRQRNKRLVTVWNHKTSSNHISLLASCVEAINTLIYGWVEEGKRAKETHMDSIKSYFFYQMLVVSHWAKERLCTTWPTVPSRQFLHTETRFIALAQH